MNTARHMPATCYTPHVAVLAAPGRTSDSVIGSGESPDRPGVLSISRPRPESFMEPARVDRFWSKVHKTDTCWLWTAGKDQKGYGIFFAGESGAKNGLRRAHIVSYQLCVGDIQNGLQLDHLCRVRSCVNPRHLEAVTPRVNSLRGNNMAARHARATHCLRGHELTGSNLIAYALPQRRLCRECEYIRRHSPKYIASQKLRDARRSGIAT